MNPTRTYERQNVYAKGGTFDDPTLLWYARGVEAMAARPLMDRTSWRFYAAIHGSHERLWRDYGYLHKGEHLTETPDTKKFWDQCQHGSWWFLPWHRGYLFAFEEIIRAAVIARGGPDDWALPYWNYFADGQEKLPPAFASRVWPDGDADPSRPNPLFVPQRYGPYRDGNVFVDLSAQTPHIPNDVDDGLDLATLAEPRFTGSGKNGTGFGGVDIGTFMHEGRARGGVESEPHNFVHPQIGGADPTDPGQKPGLMSTPGLAALDPAFWLHHANIDRLWRVWQHPDPAPPPGSTNHQNPTDPKWLNGPQDRMFSLPRADGSTWDFTPADVDDLDELGYGYDTVEWPFPTKDRSFARMLRLGADAAAVRELEEAPVAREGTSELVGANQARLAIVGTEAHTRVQLDTGARRRVSHSLALAAEATGSAPDRLFLNLEDVRGTEATSFRVYVGLPENGTSAEPREYLVARLGLFGLQRAIDADGEQAGQGLTFVTEISNTVDRLYLDGLLDVDDLVVRIEPVVPVEEAEEISIGRVSIYRLGD